MKKTKITALFMAIVTIMSCFGCFAVVSSAADNGVPFDNYHIYSTADANNTFPLTVEATICMAANTPKDGVGSTILGNYKDDKTASVSFEIQKDGSPRVLFLDNNKTQYSFIFSDVNVYTGKLTHIAFSIDKAASTISCFIDGVQKQVRKQRLPANLADTLKSPLCIGGDNRLEAAKAIESYNEQYFKGSIKNVALYSDTRTAAEIQADYTNNTYDQDNLIGYYEPVANAEKFSDKNGKGPDFNMRYSWAVTPPEVENYDYSFAVVGDTQILLYDNPDEFTALYDWIINNVESKKIKYVVGLGDITDADTTREWVQAKKDIARLNNVVPYTIVRGNHDSISKYTRYFPYSEFGDVTSDGSYDGTMLNTYKKFEINGNKYMFVNLDCGTGVDPTESDKILEWANNLVSENPDYNVIVTTHIYLDGAGELVEQTENPERYGVYGGVEIWDKFVRKHANITMVISGHVDHDHIGYSQKKGDNGNTVTQLMIDPQGVDDKLDGIGMVAMFYFSKGGKKLDIRYYSTDFDKYFSPKSQLSINLDLLESSTNTGNDDAQQGGDQANDPSSDNNNGKKKFSPLWFLLLIPVVLGAAVVIYVVATKEPVSKEEKTEEPKVEEDKPAEDKTEENKEETKAEEDKTENE